MQTKYFGLDQKDFFEKKRTKLEAYPQDPAELFVTLQAPAFLQEEEKEKISRNVALTNMCFFRVNEPALFNKHSLLALTNQLGLAGMDGNLCSDIDHISSITNESEGVKSAYVPYSNKGLTWHTDGYYNSSGTQIKGMVLYCQYPALEGGESWLYDHERLFFQLYEKSPEMLAALLAEDVLVIPENTTTEGYYRGPQAGPVFTVDAKAGQIHMRYSARKRNIEWKSSELVQEARKEIERLLSEENGYIYRYKLKRGEGVICNNVLHNRTAFVDGKNKRLIYRARYYNNLG